LEISRRSDNVSREIIHIQVISIPLNTVDLMSRKEYFVYFFKCTSWPDRSAPDDPNSLLQLIEVTNAMHLEYMDKNEEISLLVHCSAGVGRTGKHNFIKKCQVQYYFHSN